MVMWLGSIDGKNQKDNHCLQKASGVKRAGRKSLLVGDKRKRENKKRIKKEIVPRKQWNPYKMNPKTKCKKQYRNI